MINKNIYPPNIAEVLVSRPLPSEYDSYGKIPDYASVLQILEVSFLASMKKEEHRDIQFRICYMDAETDDSNEVHSTGRRWIKFQQAREFNVRELTRLAPAISPNSSLICVSRTPTSTSLQIVGIVNCRPTESTVHHQDRLFQVELPRLFNVFVSEPGELSINLGNRQLLYLKDGAIHQPTTTLFHRKYIRDFVDSNEKDMQCVAALELKKEGHQEASDDDLTPATLYRDFLYRVLSRMCELSHGGSLLLVPQQFDLRNNKLSDSVKLKYPIVNTSLWRNQIDYLKGLRKLIAELIKSGSKSLPITKEMQDASNRVLLDANFISQLTLVDGAVVMTTHFDLLGFGGEITSNAVVPTVECAVNDIIVENNSSLENNGTRHRSVYRFCYDIDGAIGFVVSQDGGVKAVKRIGDSIRTWVNVSV